MQKHLSNFQKILIDFFSVGKKIQKKIKVLILLSSLLPSFESLVTVLFMRKSTIKMNEVISVLLQTETFKRENRASSSCDDSTLVVIGGGGGKK